ncbi:MAG: UspA domain protein, partial [Marmoricola sp.]|nr:UspA domain protein [Marmoricola sp.]
QARSRITGAAPDLVVHDTLLLEDPRQLLLDLSEDAHLLVVGSRGRGPVTGLLLGSVGMALVRHARCPVVVHRPRSGDVVVPGIVVGVDGTSGAAPVLDFAYRQADLHDLPLTVLLSVWDVETSLAGSYLVADTSTRMDEERLQLSELMAGKGEDHPAVKADVQIAHGLPFEMLVDVAAETTLLVVGSRRGHLLAHLVAGSVSAAVVEHATCPVAVVPLHDQDRAELR